MKLRFFIPALAAALLVGCGAETGGAVEVPEAVTMAVTTTSALTSTVTTTTTTVISTTSETTTTAAAADPTEETTSAELAALKKLEEKYGREFTVVDRYLCWEVWGEPLPDVLNVSYTLRDSDGVQFLANVKENTDIITSDSYLYECYRERFNKAAGEALRRLLPDAKVRIVSVYGSCLPFESSAEMSYDEFVQAFIDSEGSVLAYMYVTSDTEVPDKMKEYSSRRGDGKVGELGYNFKIIVNQISQEDYDRLDDIFTEPAGEMNFTIVN